VLALTGTACLIIGIVAVYAAVKVPKPDQAAAAQTTLITYADGKTPIARLALQNREDVTLSQVPVSVQNAVLAAEDHTFRTNKGVDPKSIARAIWSNLRGNATQGGSTISQQYVKNVYNQREKTMKRKFTEVFLAVKINQKIPKDKILERYLNTIYLGRGAYGIQAASQAYFGENVEKLTPSQGAFLAGIINAPSLADPRDGAQEKARAERRWGVVTAAMVHWGWMDAATQQSLKFPKTIPQVSMTSATGQNAYLQEMAEEEVEAQYHVTAAEIQSGGYKIVTTFNPAQVKDGVKAVKDRLLSVRGKPAGIRLGMAAIDPRNGAITAIYGGTNIKTQLNQAAKDRAQGGSTFKAFGLMAALENGVSLKNVYDSSGPRVIAGQPVKNDDGSSVGYINLIQAMAKSVNTVYVQLNHENGPKKTLAAALAAGLPQDTPGLGSNLVNVLGSANVRPIDMASAYATFAAGGIYHKPHCVASISSIGDSKKVLYTGPTSGKRVFDANDVADLDYALQHVVQNGTGVYAKALGRPVAGKTGTSSQSKSAWFVGYTPQLATAVGMHETKGKKGAIVPMKGFGGFPDIFGNTFPIRIWTQFMQAALQGQKVIQFPNPVYGGDVTNVAPTTAAPTMSSTPTDQPTQQPTTNPTMTRPPHSHSPTTSPTTTTTTTSSRPTSTATFGKPGQ